MARGGYRPGAGRPRGPGKRKKVAARVVEADLKVSPAVGIAAQEANLTPMAYLLRVMRDPQEDAALRSRAAALLLPFVHPKTGEAGKKAKATKDATGAESGTSWDELLPKFAAQ